MIPNQDFYNLKNQWHLTDKQFLCQRAGRQMPTCPWGGSEETLVLYRPDSIGKYNHWEQSLFGGKGTEWESKTNIRFPREEV
jgi:hypothetical protein